MIIEYEFWHGRSAGNICVPYIPLARGSGASRVKAKLSQFAQILLMEIDRVKYEADCVEVPLWEFPYVFAQSHCRWITSFQNDWSIQVVVGGSCSDTKTINTGVRQDSMLTPTLSILLIIDMLFIDNIRYYADGSVKAAGRYWIIVCLLTDSQGILHLWTVIILPSYHTKCVRCEPLQPRSFSVWYGALPKIFFIALLQLWNKLPYAGTTECYDMFFKRGFNRVRALLWQVATQMRTILALHKSTRSGQQLPLSGSKTRPAIKK